MSAVLLRRTAWQARLWAGGVSYQLASSSGWRVSVATIERDGPFTAFPGWHRRTLLLSGAGFRLGATLVAPDIPDVAYPGEPPPPCALIDGPVRVLNVFTDSGSSVGVTRVEISGAASTGRDGAATVAICLDAGPIYAGEILDAFDSVHADGPLTLLGSGTMLVVALTTYGRAAG